MKFKINDNEIVENPNSNIYFIGEKSNSIDIAPDSKNPDHCVLHGDVPIKGDIYYYEKIRPKIRTVQCIECFNLFHGNKSPSEIDGSIKEIGYITEEGKELLVNQGIISSDTDPTTQKTQPTSPPQSEIENLEVFNLFIQFMKNNIIVRQSNIPSEFSKWAETRLNFSRIQISTFLNNMLPLILSKQIIRELDTDENSDFNDFIKSIGKSGRVKKWYIHYTSFMKKYEKFMRDQGKGTQQLQTPIIISAPTISSETSPSPTVSTEDPSGDWRDIPIEEEVQFNTSKFPPLEKIYEYYNEFHKYLEFKGVIVEKSFVRKVLLTVKKDKSFILYGEPGDGKSLFLKYFLEWLTQIYNGGLLNDSLDPTTQSVIIQERKAISKKFPSWKLPLNPQIKGVPKYGVSWESQNIDESTNPLTLYGGYAPESLSSGDKSKRRYNIDLGIISTCIKDGSYCFLDELNRTENETLGRLMGFLEEPYSYKLNEGNLKFVLRSSVNPRANWFIAGTMNVGDVGNFKMSSAFKRRFKIIEINYPTEMIVKIIKKVRGINKRSKKAKFIDSVELICDGNNIGEDALKSMDLLIEAISKYIFEFTHEMKENADVKYGVGVAHIMATLDDIAIYTYSLFRFELKGKKGIYIRGSSFSDDIKKIITDSVNENIIMSLIDEGDTFKQKELEPQFEVFIDSILNKIMIFWTLITSNLNDSAMNQPLDDFPFSEFIDNVWTFGRK